MGLIEHLRLTPIASAPGAVEALLSRGARRDFVFAMAPFYAPVTLLLTAAVVAKAAPYLSSGSPPWPLILPSPPRWRARAASAVFQSLATSFPDMKILFQRSNRGFQEFSTEQQVENAIRDEYTLAPDSEEYNTLTQGTNCSGLSSTLHKNLVPPNHQLRPTWLHNSELIGDCPTNYTNLNKPSFYRPSRIQEATCACEGSPCSEDGHQCVPVSRYVPIWVRHTNGDFVNDRQEVVIACVCARRQSGVGNNVYSPAISG
ncbi:uncharacterized protein LOC143033121 [Oratosquilla oratoria]|uniref:uncharacterized protein LOC143033121 n=1 Tax=Oratosquilla oratoria TaxID=337810 RepID=UPI003F76B663